MRSVSLMAVVGVAGLLGSPAMAGAPELVATSDTTLARPHDLVVSDDGLRLYVSDMENHVIKVLDASTLAVLGEIGRGDLRSPHDVTFDEWQRLLVADTGNNRIVIYRLDGVRGKYEGELKGGLSSPEGVAVARDGRVFVTNAGTGAIVVFEGARVAVNRGDLGLRRPHDIEIHRNGTVYVADSGNHRIVVLDRDLKPLRELRGPTYRFDEPKYLAFDDRGWLYVADEDNNQVRIFINETQPMAVIGSGQTGTGPNQLRKPEGVTPRGNRVWISDTYNNRVVLYRLP